jgi:hypothetical protein
VSVVVVFFFRRRLVGGGDLGAAALAGKLAMNSHTCLREVVGSGGGAGG